jgi:REP element-mobilizing transposase RayT
MVHGYHVIFVTYGAWLPNDPRGSWSDFVAAWELYYFGMAGPGIPVGSLSDNEQVAIQRSLIQRNLKYPAMQLTGNQSIAVADGFSNALTKYGLTIWACSVLPEHIHLVLARTGKSCETMTNFLKGEATRELNQRSLHPLANYSEHGRTPQPWARNHWQVYLDSEQAIENAIAYVNENPVKEGKSAQDWACVSPFAGIPGGKIFYPD